MTMVEEVWVDRTNFRNTKHVEFDLPNLDDGEILVRIDKFGLTANNVSYALSGDQIGYWKFYPAQGNWGRVPIWGFADVIASRSDEISVGERLWGFYPMASHVVLQPGDVRKGRFTDVTAHRTALPALYNQYNRTAAEPDFLKPLEDERCVLFPLFVTSYVIYDYLTDNDFFGAAQVLIGSVSSKTGLGLAHLLHHDKNVNQKIIGLTSPGNVAFVERLHICDEIITYGNESKIDSGQNTAFVDMSGNGALIAALHHHLGDHMVESCIVGATHWEGDRQRNPLPGAKPTFFFAPSQIGKREQEWGSGVLMQKAFGASAEIADSIKGEMEIAPVKGAQALADAWRDLLDNKVPPSRGLIVSLV